MNSSENKEKKPLDPNKVATLIMIIIGINIGLTVLLLYSRFSIPRLLYLLFGLMIINGILMTAWIVNNSRAKLIRKDATGSNNNFTKESFWFPFLKRLIILFIISLLIWLALSFIVSMDVIYAIPVSIGLSPIVMEIFSKESTLYPD